MSISEEEFDRDRWQERIKRIKIQARESYLRVKAKKDAETSLLSVRDIPADTMVKIEADCIRYREVLITAALKRLAAAKLKARKPVAA